MRYRKEDMQVTECPECQGEGEIHGTTGTAPNQRLVVIECRQCHTFGWIATPIPGAKEVK